MTFAHLKINDIFHLPGGLLAYRKINNTQAICYPTDHPQIVGFVPDEVIEVA